MNPDMHGMTHGANGLLLGYATIAVPLLAGLIQKRAPLDKVLLSPLLAVPVTLIAALVNAAIGPLLFGPKSGGDNLIQLGFGMLVFIAIGYGAGRFIAARGRPSGSLHRRGAVIAHAESLPSERRGEARSETNRRDSEFDTPITLAGCELAPEDETKHFKLIGTTGTGKSTAIREMLSAALARGDRAIIADPDCGYLNNFYDPRRGDVILNPFDPDAAKWNLFDEITRDYDVDQLARSLIPDSGDDHTWSEYARTFFISVTQQAIKAGIRDDAELYRLLQQASVQDLRILLAGTAAGPFLEEGSEKMFGSLRSVTVSAVRALQYTTRQKATPFSVRHWVRNGASRHAGGKGGVLFLPYKAGEIAALRSTISAWMRIAIFEAMDQGERDQRLWFVVDELDALGEIDGLKDALARLRKFGGRCVLGFQSIAQVSGTYGKGAADTIVENCGNTFILRCSASERGGTSEFASKLIGQREVIHTTRSRTRNSTSWFGSSTSSEQIRIEPAIMASEIERLPDLEGFLKVASIPDWRRVRLTPVSYAFVVRPPRPTSATAAPTSAAAATAPPALSKPSATKPSAISPAPETSAPAAAPPAGSPTRTPRPRRAKSSLPTAKRGLKPKSPGELHE